MKIELKNITKKYGDKVIFKNLNISLLSTGIYILSGTNGIGKSTLLNILSLDDLSFKGKIYFNDEKIKSNNREFYRINTISYSHQLNYFLGDRTLLENIKTLFDSKTVDEITSILTLLKIDTLQNVLFECLSDGEKNRVNIACSLLKESDVLIFDESFTYLDHATAINIIKYIKSNFTDKIVIITTHENLDFLNLDEFQIIDLNKILTSESKENVFFYKNIVENHHKEKTENDKPHYIKSILKENRYNIIFSFIFNFIFVSLLIFNSFISSFNFDFGTYLNNSYIYNNYSIAQYSDYENLDNSYYLDRFFCTNNELSNIHSLTQSPIIYCYKVIPYTLIEGKMPINDNEIVISSKNYEIMLENGIVKNLDDLQNLEVFNSTKIVGVYQFSDDYISKKLIDKLQSSGNETPYHIPALSFMRFNSFSVISKENLINKINEKRNIYIDIRNVPFKEIKNKTSAPSFIYLKDSDDGQLSSDIAEKINSITLYLNFGYLLIIVIINVLSISLFYSYSKKKISFYRINGASRTSVIKIISSFFLILLTSSILPSFIFSFASPSIVKALTSSLTYSSGFEIFGFNSTIIWLLLGCFAGFLIVLFVRFRNLLTKNASNFYIKEKEEF